VGLQAIALVHGDPALLELLSEQFRYWYRQPTLQPFGHPPAVVRNARSEIELHIAVVGRINRLTATQRRAIEVRLTEIAGVSPEAVVVTFSPGAEEPLSDDSGLCSQGCVNVRSIFFMADADAANESATALLSALTRESGSGEQAATASMSVDGVVFDQQATLSVRSRPLSSATTFVFDTPTALATSMPLIAFLGGIGLVTLLTRRNVRKRRTTLGSETEHDDAGVDCCSIGCCSVYSTCTYSCFVCLGLCGLSASCVYLFTLVGWPSEHDECRSGDSFAHQLLTLSGKLAELDSLEGPHGEGILYLGGGGVLGRVDSYSYLMSQALLIPAGAAVLCMCCACCFGCCTRCTMTKGRNDDAWYAKVRKTTKCCTRCSVWIINLALLAAFAAFVFFACLGATAHQPIIRNHLAAVTNVCDLTLPRLEQAVIDVESSLDIADFAGVAEDQIHAYAVTKDAAYSAFHMYRDSCACAGVLFSQTERLFAPSMLCVFVALFSLVVVNGLGLSAGCCETLTRKRRWRILGYRKSPEEEEEEEEAKRKMKAKPTKLTKDRTEPPV
jgi:hypothetical protein